MPDQERTPEARTTSQFTMSVTLFGDIKPSPDLHRRPQRSLKAHTDGEDYFTDITLHDGRNNGGMRVEYTVTAASPQGASRAGAVYLSQLCDLLTTVTRTPVWFYMPHEDASDERIRVHRRTATVERILTTPEWFWITGNLVDLRQSKPRFLAAASWYRKGLIGGDVLDDFCCFWRVIERIAYSYADKSDWSDEDKRRSAVRKCVSQLRDDLFPSDAPPVLADDTVGDIIKLRNDISHGNIPILLDEIDLANAYLPQLEDAAFTVLKVLRQRWLDDEFAA